MILLLFFVSLTSAQSAYYVQYSYTDAACSTQPYAAKRILALDNQNCAPVGCALVVSSNPPIYTKTVCPSSYSSLGADNVGHCPASPMPQWSSFALNRCVSNRFSSLSYYMTNCVVGASITEVTFTGTLNCSGVTPTTTVIALNSCINGPFGFNTWFSCTNAAPTTTTSGMLTTSPATAALISVAAFLPLIFLL